jgi:hypothetical protein
VVALIKKGVTIPEFSPLQIRNAINTAIKASGVAKVERSPKNNIILTVNPTTISAEGLLAKRALWEKALESFPVSTILLPTS